MMLHAGDRFKPVFLPLTATSRETRLFDMKTILATSIFLAVGLAAAQTPIEPKAPITLFDGKNLDGWTAFTPEQGADPAKLFCVKDGVIACPGKPVGYLKTDKAYANYRLHVEWRWQTEGFDPGPKKRRRNNGVLLHASGPDKVWPRSIEAQLMEENAGDIFVIDGTTFDEHKAAVEKAVAEAGSDPEKTKKAQGNRRVPKQGDSSEKPLGEWNAYDIICRGDSIELRVNGELKNKATRCNVSSGHICLQSEGAPIEFRNVRIEPLP